MATVVSQVGQGHHYMDYDGRIIKQSAEQLPCVTERQRLVVLTVYRDHTECGCVCAKTTAQCFDAQPPIDLFTIAAVRVGSPDEPVSPRRRVVAKRPPTATEEYAIRQKCATLT